MARHSNEMHRALAPQVDLDQIGEEPLRDPKWGWVLGNLPGSAAYITQDPGMIDVYIQRQLENLKDAQSEGGTDPTVIEHPGILDY